MAITLLASISNLLGVSKNLLFSNKSKIGDLFIDGTHLEVINYSNTMTDHPVEGGSSISDHVYTNPLKVMMTGSITDSSVDVFNTAKDFINIFDGNILTNVVDKFRGRGTKSTLAYELLKDLHTTKSTVSIINYLDTFDNMIIETLSFPRNNKTGDRLFFEITLKQITLASVKTVNISSSSRSTVDAYSSKSILGRQQTKAPTSTETSNTRSAAKNIYNYHKQ